MLKKNVLKITLIFVGVILLITAIVTLAVSAGRGDGNAFNEKNGNSKEASVSDIPYAKPLTVLAVGKDSAAGLSDALMLVRIEPAEQRATALQIPRDTYAEYTENSYKKINGAVSALGGTAQLCSFLSESFGIEINGYVSVDMEVLPSLVDSVGGVEIELGEPLVYNDPEQELYINIPAGKQKLDGKSALHFIRYRSGYVRGDIGRMDAQKVFLASLGKKVRSLDTIDLARLASAMLPKIETDLTLSQAISFTKIISDIPDENITFVTLPGDEAVAEKSGASYYSISAPAAEEILCTYFGLTAGGFDKKALFRNEKYESFKKCYDNYAPYKLYTAASIYEKGIIIDKHD
jgi:LCP family protein required for cell wall assembly